ncbi:MAG: pyridoxal phosphate-dependent aminotransferase [Synergistaceae bacterium]|jgi:aspartate/methionine/tyrosine aminotransferase|nr:pyridoxal phosphate-dependent aminotransferase [Synergistaceae bacterium]
MKFANRYAEIKINDMAKVFQAIEKIDGVLNLSIGEPDFNTEPDIIDAGAEAAKKGFTHYPPLQGFPDFREALCSYWQRHHGLKASPDEVIIAVGGIQVPHLALQALLNPGDEVILIEPYFTPYADQVEMSGGVPVRVATSEENGFSPTASELERVITPRTRGIFVNSPNNPSGRVMPRVQMEEIAELVIKHDMFLLSDEIYEALVYKGKHVPFATLPGVRDRVLTMGGMSKSHCMTGWRLGYGIGPVDLVRRMTAISASQTYGVNAPAQKASTYALNTQDAKLAERRKIFAERMEYVTKRLNAMKGVSCASPEGAFYLFPNVKGTGLGSEDFVWKLLEKAKVAVLPGNAFGKSGEGHIRIACTQSLEVLKRAMDKMEEFLK